MDSLPAVAELVEQGATVEGDDKASVIAAASIALDLAAESDEGLDVSVARMVAVEFLEDGDVIVHAVTDEGSDAVRAALKGADVQSVTVAAADIEEVFAEARKIEAGEDEGDDEESKGDAPSRPAPPAPAPMT
jgi:hypothetical protein